MRTQSQTHYVRRLGLWLLGQALPDAGVLRKPARLALISVLVASAAGTLLALSVVATLIGLFMYLQGEGLSMGASLSIVGLVGMMAGMVVYLIAQRRLDSVPDSLADLQLFQGRPTDIFGELVQMAVGGFLEGLSDTSERTNTAKRATKNVKDARSAIEEEIESLIEKLEALEAEAAEEEVVLEIDVPRKRKP